MNTSDILIDSLPIIVSCQVEQEKLDALASLVRELLPIASIPDLAHLRGVLVVPDEARVQIVNELIQKLGKSEISYVAGSQSRACAVPIEIDASLACFVILSESVVQQIDQEHYRSFQLVSMLLEEFLHVRLYSLTWQRRGHITPPHIEPSCRKDLFVMCSNFHNEYVVNRWKASIISSQPLFERDGQMTPGYILYGRPLVPILDQAAANLLNTIHAAASKTLSASEAWTQLLHSVSQDVFDPLARDAALQAGNPTEAPRLPKGASESWYYRQRIAPYWQRVKAQLEHSFEGELAETDIALDEIVKILEEFLMHMGVVYHKTKSGDCYVNFISF